MITFVSCPRRGDRKIALEVCVAVCESYAGCEEMKEIPEDDINAALLKASGSPVPAEMVTVDGSEIEIGAEPAEEKPEGEAKVLLERAVSIKNEIDIKFWEMGAILHGIYVNQYYVDYGYRDWKAFCEDVLGMKWRTATYLRDIYVKMSALGIKPEDCLGIGWGKLKELLPIVSKENVKHWLNEARKKNVSVAVLNARVKLALGKITEEESKHVPSQLVFRLYEEQLKNVERALEIARRMTGSESRGYGLEMISVEFRTTYETVEGEYSKTKLIDDLVGRLENLFGVSFKGEIVDASTGEIIREAK